MPLSAGPSQQEVGLSLDSAPSFHGEKERLSVGGWEAWQKDNCTESQDMRIPTGLPGSPAVCPSASWYLHPMSALHPVLLLRPAYLLNISPLHLSLNRTT